MKVVIIDGQGGRLGQLLVEEIILPVSHCNNQVVGVRQMTMTEMVTETITTLKKYSKSNQ